MQLQFNIDGDNDTLNLWLLTEIPEDEADLGDPTVSINANVLESSTDLAYMALFLRTTGDTGIWVDNTNALLFDGIRIGTNITDVVAINPIPEPSMMALLILCATAGLLVKRRFCM